MSKSGPDSLHLLIRSMKKSEKRYFNIYSSMQSGDKLYLRMFSFFSLHENPNPDEFIRKEGGRKGSSWYAMAKSRTYQRVMDSLTDLYSDVNTEISKHIAQAEILFNRELFEMGFKHLGIARKLALKNECFALAYVAAEREYKMKLQTFLHQKKFAQLLEEQEDILSKLNNAKAYYFLAQRIYQYYITHGISVQDKEYDIINKFKNDPLLQNENLAQSIEAREYCYLAHSFLAGMVGDYDRSNFYTKKRTQLYFDNPFKIRNNRYGYLYILNNALITSLYAKKYKELLAYLKKLDDIRPHLETDIEKKTAFYMRNHELSYYIDTYQMDKAKVVSDLVEKELPYYEKSLNEIQKRILFVFIAYVYFSRKEYRQTIFWLNKVLYKGAPKLRIDMFSFYSIFYFIAHYEAGSSRDLLASIYQSAFRYISIRDKMNSFYKLMKMFMRSFLLKDVEKAELLAGFKKLKTDLTLMEKNSMKDNAPIYFDFKPWIEMNIERLEK